MSSNLTIHMSFPSPCFETDEESALAATNEGWTAHE